MNRIILSLILATLALPLFAQTTTKTLVNVDGTGVAIHGYEPVAFFKDNKPVKGDQKFLIKHDGAIYFFATKEHKDLFKENAAKYEPEYG